MCVDRSESINELAKALCKAQASMKPVPKDSANDFKNYKYADLAAVWENCRKPLTENGLSVIQSLDYEENRVIVKTILVHESGQWVASRLGLIPVKDDPQSYGSAITYARRYALAALVGVAAEDEDDDGQAASTSPKSPGVEVPPRIAQGAGKRNSAKGGLAPVGEAVGGYLEELRQKVKEFGVSPEFMRQIIKDRYGKNSSKELSRLEVDDLIQHIEELNEIPLAGGSDAQ
jgi:hypothetical protein